MATLALVCAALGSAAAATPAWAAPPGRAYELVSPPEGSGSADALPFARPSASGDAIAFQMLEPASGGTLMTTYLSRRGENGWSSRRLTPPTAQGDPPRPGLPAYRLPRSLFYVFSPDLSQGVFTTRNNPALVQGEPPVSNLYLLDTRTDATSLITTPTPTTSTIPDAIQPPPRVVWASSDMQHVLFDSMGGHTQAFTRYFPPDGPQWGVYVWSPGEQLTRDSIVSRLPDGRIANDAVGGAGPLHPLYPEGPFFSDWYGGDRHAISEDGSRIFFTTPRLAIGVVIGQLYVRKDHGTPQATTVRIDQREPGVPAEPGFARGSRFIAATPDGHKALFETCARLTLDSTAISQSHACQNELDWRPAFSNKPELYLWNEDANGGAGDLVDITTGDPDGADVLGVVGATEDLTRVYFVARGNLADGAVDGQPNLYLWDEATGITFVATLFEESAEFWDIRTDEDVWLPQLGDSVKDAKTSANGRWVAFSTVAPIDPTFDNTDPETGDPRKQVYLWEIGDDAPTCVSCVEDGPHFDSTIQTQRLDAAERTLPSFPDWEKRNVLDDGRLYFESGERLTSEDRNNLTDVYEYDPSFDRLTLISSGLSGEPANFLGATAGGRDVFFRTTQHLVEWDTGDGMHVYDARMGGGDIVPPPPPPPPCTGANCEPPAGAGFSGPDDPQPGEVVRFAAARIRPRQVRLFARTGRLQLRATVPGAGRLTALATARLRKGSRKMTRVGAASTLATQPGRVALTLRLSGRAREVLRRRGRLQIRIQLRFGSEQRTAVLRLTRPRPETRR